MEISLRNWGKSTGKQITCPRRPHHTGEQLRPQLSALHLACIPNKDKLSVSGKCMQRYVSRDVLGGRRTLAEWRARCIRCSLHGHLYGLANKHASIHKVMDVKWPRQPGIHRIKNHYGKHQCVHIRRHPQIGDNVRWDGCSVCWKEAQWNKMPSKQLQVNVSGGTTWKTAMKSKGRSTSTNSTDSQEMQLQAFPALVSKNSLLETYPHRNVSDRSSWKPWQCSERKTRT